MVGAEVLARLRMRNSRKSHAEAVAAVRRLRAGGPSPAVIVGVAFAAGFLLAKIIDWRSHAHPRS